MRTIETTPMQATLTIGRNVAYTKKRIPLKKMIRTLSEAQQNLYAMHGTRLSAKVTPCRIVFAGQDEKSVTIRFINYPKFPLEETGFMKGVEYIAETMMKELHQNRIVIEYPGKTVMYENTDRIDPKIKI